MDILKNRYQIIEKLGKGSFGEVYKAYDIKDKKFVAIKRMYYDNEDDKELVEQELEALKLISENLNVCNKYAICYKDNFIYNDDMMIVMDYIDGYSLNMYMNKIALNERNESESILEDLIVGLGKLHSMGITHQDIKEGNLMYDKVNKRYKYVDWGAACLKKYCQGIYCDDPPCGYSGTSYTVPPEIKEYGGGNLQSFPMEIAHDIWSLGVVLLNWYTFKDYRDWIKYMTEKNTFARLNEKTAPYYLSQEELDKTIDGIDNEIAKKVIKLMLRRDWTERLKNWEKVVTIFIRKKEYEKLYTKEDLEEEYEQEPEEYEQEPEKYEEYEEYE